MYVCKSDLQDKARISGSWEIHSGNGSAEALGVVRSFVDTEDNALERQWRKVKLKSDFE